MGRDRAGGQAVAAHPGAAMTASQSIHAIGVPSLMQAAVSTWQPIPPEPAAQG